MPVQLNLAEVDQHAVARAAQRRPFFVGSRDRRRAHAAAPRRRSKASRTSLKTASRRTCGSTSDRNAGGGSIAAAPRPRGRSTLIPTPQPTCATPPATRETHKIPATLRVADEEVVGPAQVDVHGAGARDPVGDARARPRTAPPTSRRAGERRGQDRREEQAGAERRDPRAAGLAAAAGGLLVGDQGRTRAVGAREQRRRIVVGRAGPGLIADVGEPRARQRDANVRDVERLKRCGLLRHVSPSSAMAIERTLILAKADAVVRGLVGEMLSRFERRGYTIVGMKLLMVEAERAKKHYAEHAGKPFFAGLVEYITARRSSRW